MWEVCCGTSARVCDASEGAAVTSTSVLRVPRLSAPGCRHFIAFVFDRVPWKTRVHAELADVRRWDCPAGRCDAVKVPVREEAAGVQMGVQTRAEPKTTGNDSFIPRLEKNVSLSASGCGRSPSTQPAFVFANKILKTPVPTAGMSVGRPWLLSHVSGFKTFSDSLRTKVAESKHERDQEKTLKISNKPTPHVLVQRAVPQRHRSYKFRLLATGHTRRRAGPIRARLDPRASRLVCGDPDI